MSTHSLATCAFTRRRAESQSHPRASVRTGLAISVGACLCLTLPAQADFGLLEAQETFMTAQSIDSALLATVFGIDLGAVLNFSSDLNASTRAFSYTLLPNQFYNGAPLSLSTTGIYDPGLRQYSWTTRGQLGNTSWSFSESAVWIGDPITTLPPRDTVINGVTYTVTGDFDYDDPDDLTGTSKTKSKGTFSIKDSAGNTFGPFAGTDRFIAQAWQATFTIPAKTKPNNTDKDIVVIADGDGPFRGQNPPLVGPGDFTLQFIVGTVPEPEILTLFAVGFAPMVHVLRRRRRESKRITPAG
jgi:hypothetical protein